MQPVGLSKSELRKVKHRLPERYLSPLPVLPTPETPVRECNTGETFRRSSVFGIHRAFAGPLPSNFFVQIGDYVHASESVVGRVTALYVSGVTKGLCASVRLLMTTSELKQKLGLPQPITDSSGEEIPSYVLLETEEELHHVPLETIERRCSLGLPGGPWPKEYFLAGYYLRKKGLVAPWCRPLRSSEVPQYGKPGAGPANPTFLPVLSLGFIGWCDDFQTFVRRQFSTTSLAVTFNVYPYPLRVAPAMIRLLSCFPPGVDDMEVFRIIFWCLLRLEKGVVMPAAVTEGSAFVKVRLSLYLSYVARMDVSPACGACCP